MALPSAPDDWSVGSNAVIVRLTSGLSTAMVTGWPLSGIGMVLLPTFTVIVGGSSNAAVPVVPSLVARSVTGSATCTWTWPPSSRMSPTLVVAVDTTLLVPWLLSTSCVVAVVWEASTWAR